MKSINVYALKEMMDSKEDFQLIDVREKSEYEAANLGGIHIPMGTIEANVDKIAKDKSVVVHCRSGKRSATVIDFLEKNHGFTNLYNLEGGILAWADDIDESMPRV